MAQPPVPPPPQVGGPQQHCHRCHAALPVQGRVLPWCPRCGGVLTDPVSSVPWTTRWVAQAPGPRSAPTRSPVAPGPTPRYSSVPRWGLGNRAWRHPLELVERAAPSDAVRARALAASARPLLIGALVAHTASAAAEGWRYGLVVAGRTELLPAATVALSDSAVVVTGVLAPLVSLVAAVTVATWLLRARHAAAERSGHRDTRRPWTVLAGALVPVVNLAQAGVLVSELAAELGERVRPTLVRAWWAAWALSGVLAVLPWLWRLQGTVQAQADAILLGGVSAAFAAVTAGLTARLVREGTEVLGAPARRAPRRWVASVPAAP